MGFIKKPKINIPVAEPVQEEPPVVVETVREETANDYNARAKNKKTLLSTILSKQYQASKADNNTNTTNSGLSQTLG